jgi:hypothetical protein
MIVLWIMLCVFGIFVSYHFVLGFIEGVRCEPWPGFRGKPMRSFRCKPKFRVFYGDEKEDSDL